jgi:hypothetical protein
MFCVLTFKARNSSAGLGLDPVSLIAIVGLMLVFACPYLWRYRQG